MSRPTYGRPGSTSALPGPAYDFSGRNISYPGRNSRSWAGRQQIRPFLAGVSSSLASGGVESRLGQSSGVPGHCGWAGLETVRLGRSGVTPAWAGARQVPAGPVRGRSRLGRCASPRLGRLLPIPGWADSRQSPVWAGFPRPSRVPAAGPTRSESRLGRFRPIPAWAGAGSLARLSCVPDQK
jgi:hypothetical protein